jgi:hypothetical protein
VDRQTRLFSHPQPSITTPRACREAEILTRATQTCVGAIETGFPPEGPRPGPARESKTEGRRVRLDDEEWRQRLLDVARSRPWRLIVFDPFARVKGAVDEDRQREIGPVLDFLRELRDAARAAVAYVHHTPHDGSRQRGSSDLEAYWESKLTLAKEASGRRTLRADHREAEAAGPFALSFGFDAATGTLRLRASRDELEARVRAYLDDHPDASANEVDDNVEGTREKILDLVRQYRESGSEASGGG